MENSNSIYGSHLPVLEETMDKLMRHIAEIREVMTEQLGMDPVEHCLCRIKSEESMREKCRRNNLPETAESALTKLYDAIGLRIVCAFVDDVYTIRDYLVNSEQYKIVKEKDYIRRAKPNGYRSYHMIMRTCDGRVPAGCEPDPSDADAEPVRGVYLEIQLRTISMDTWAVLDHQLQYKQEMVCNAKLISSELKRCADELASTDLSMQAIRDMIADARKETE